MNARSFKFTVKSCKVRPNFASDRVRDALILENVQESITANRCVKNLFETSIVRFMDDQVTVTIIFSISDKSADFQTENDWLVKMISTHFFDMIQFSASCFDFDSMLADR
jgi:hypothetical protein